MLPSVESYWLCVGRSESANHLHSKRVVQPSKTFVALSEDQIILRECCSAVCKHLDVRVFHSVLWRCWLGNRKGIQPVKNVEPAIFKSSSPWDLRGLGLPGVIFGNAVATLVCTNTNIFLSRQVCNYAVNEKSAQRRRKHCALAVVRPLRRSQKISPAADGGTGRPKFNPLEMVTTFTYKPSLVKIDARNFELSW